MGALNEAAHRRHSIRVEEDVGAVRRGVAQTAGTLVGIPPGQAALAATELATNIVRHASAGGYLLYRPLVHGLELIAVDHGPGMRVPWTRPEATAIPPGGAGLGVGLAGVERLASTFDLYSVRGEGTVVLARLGTPPSSRSGPLWWGGVNVPLGGDGDSGDGWAVAPGGGRLAALVVDGLGHGPRAHEGAEAAIAALGERPADDLPGYLLRAHEAMRRTRGGVLGVGAIDLEQGRLTYAGVGNVSGQVRVGDVGSALLSREGTVGTALEMPQARVGTYAWGPGATLVLASDGLRSHRDLVSSPDLLGHDPTVIAATVLRQAERNGDDATVLVVRDEREPGG